MADINEIKSAPLIDQSKAVENLNVADATGVNTEISANQSIGAKRSELTVEDVQPGIAKTMLKSRQTASAIAPEAGILSKIENFGKTLKSTNAASDIQKRRSETAIKVWEFKEKNPDLPVPESYEAELIMLRRRADKINKDLSEVDPSLLSQGAAAMASSWRDTIKAVIERPGTVATSAGAGAGFGLIGSAPGVVAGTIAGTAYGVLATGVIDNVRRTRGETYDELSIAKRNGQPLNLSEESKRAISNSIGILGGAVEFGLERWGLSKIPGVRGLFKPSTIRKAIEKNPAFAQTLTQFGKGIAANMVGEGAVEGLQYNLDLVAKELGQSWDGSETSIYKALDKLGRKTISQRPAVDEQTGQQLVNRQGQTITESEKYLSGLGQSVAVGALAGGTGATVLGTVGTAYERLQVAVDKNRPKKPNDPVKPAPSEAIQPDDKGVDKTLTPDEGSVETQKIIIDESGEAKFLNSQQSLTLALVLQNTTDAVKESKIEGNLSTAVELQKNMIEESGFNQGFIKAEDLTTWADTPEKRDKITSWFGNIDLEQGRKIPVTSTQMAEMLQDDPEWAKNVSPTVDDMTFNEALEYYRDRPDRINRDFARFGLQAQTEQTPISTTSEGVPVREPQPSTGTEMLGDASTDEDIINTLGNKQAAFEYLDRLESEEAAILGTQEQLTIGDLGPEQIAPIQTDQLNQPLNQKGKDDLKFFMNSMTDEQRALFDVENMTVQQAVDQLRQLPDWKMGKFAELDLVGTWTTPEVTQPTQTDVGMNTPLDSSSKFEMKLMLGGRIDNPVAAQIRDQVDTLTYGQTLQAIERLKAEGIESNPAWVGYIREQIEKINQESIQQKNEKSQPVQLELFGKSFEEQNLKFVPNDEGTPVYHGTNKDFAVLEAGVHGVESNTNPNGGIFLTDSQVTAKFYAEERTVSTGQGQPKIINSIIKGSIVDLSSTKRDSIPPSLVTALQAAKETDPTANQILQLGNITYTSIGMSPTVVKWMNDNGYSAAKITDSHPGSKYSFYVPNPDNITYVADNGTELTPAQQKRLKAVQDMKARVQTAAQALPEMDMDPDSSNDITFDEEAELALKDFATRPVYTDLIRAGISKNTRMSIETQYAEIRQDIIKATKTEAYNEMISTANVVDEIAKTEDAIDAIESALEDPDVQMVETYNVMLTTHGADAQINPETLTPEQRNRYENDPVLKKRGVFNKYGTMTIEQLGLELGQTSGDQAMQILAKTPDLDQVFKNIKELTKTAIDTEILDNVDYNNTAIIKALEKKQKLDNQVFEMLIETSWAKARAGVEGVIFAKPNMDMIRESVALEVSRIPVGRLNPNIYARASKKANVRKVKASLRGDFLEASKQRELELKNDEAYKQSLVIKGRSNRWIKKLGRWSRSKAIIQTLRDANLYDAYLDLTKLVNIDKAAPTKQGEFAKAVKAAIENQTLDMTIPQDIVENFNPAATPSELSFEQLSFIYNKHSELIKEANNLDVIQEQQEELYTSQVAETIVTELSDHPDRDESRSNVENKVLKGATKNLMGLLKKIHSNMPNINYYTLFLARGSENKFIRKIYDQLKGIGVYANGFGETATIAARSKLKKTLKAVQKINDRRKRVQNYAKEIIEPVEFRDTKNLTDSTGRMTKLQLMSSVLFYGSHEGRQRLGNFGVDPETFLQVADKYLTADDVDFIQSIWNLFDTYKPDIKRRQEMIRGHDVTFIEGAGFEFKGKTYRGGYVPLRYIEAGTIEERIEKSERDADIMVGEIKDFPIDAEASEAFTKDGNLIERAKNSDRILNLDWNYIIGSGFDDIIVQTTMHVPILNVMRILNNDDVSKELEYVLGKQEAQEFKNLIIGTGNSVNTEHMKIMSEMQDSGYAVVNYLATNFIKNTLVGVPSTVLMQLSSGAYAWGSQGIGSTGTYVWTIAKIATQPWRISKYIQEAATIDPSIGSYIDNVTEDRRGGIKDVLAKDLYVGGPGLLGQIGGKIVQGIQKFDELQTTIFLEGILGSIDMMIKVPAVLTMKSRFKSGKIKGYGMDVISKMSPQELENEANAYAARTSQATLTASSNIEKSKIQRGTVLRNWALYFNDVRNIYNWTMLNTVTKTRWNMNDARKDWNSGDYLDATFKLGSAAMGLMAIQFYATFAATMISVARGRGEDWDDEEIELSPMGTAAWEEEVLSTALANYINPLTIPKNVVSGLPILRDISFSLDIAEATGGRFKTIVAPMDVSAINVLSEGLHALQMIYVNDGEFPDPGTPQFRALLKGSATVLPVPYRAIDYFYKSDSFENKTSEVLEDPGIAVTGLMALPAMILKLADSLIGRYQVEAQQGVPEAQEKIEFVQAIKDKIDPNKVDKIKELAEKAVTPLSNYDEKILMFTESGGNPKASALTSSAYGLYQFTFSTWKDMVDKYGSYGLTIDGRRNSTSQQRLAFKLLTRENAIALSRNGIEPNLESLYAAHHFGQSLAIQLYQGRDSDKIPSGFIEKSVRKANPWIDGRSRNIKRVVKTKGDMKQSLRDLLAIGKKNYIESLNVE